MNKVYYYNRNGVLKLTFGEDPYYMLLGSGEFKDQKWDCEEQYGLLKSFRRNKFNYPFSVIIKSDDLADYDALCDIFTEDILAKEPGFLVINGWRLDCYVVTSSHSWYGGRDRVIAFEAISSGSTWIRTNTKSYDGIPGGSSFGDDLGRDYTNDSGFIGRGYNYGYSQPESHYDSIDLPGSGNGFELIIYGPQSNPVIYLDNQPIQVNITLSATERLRVVSNSPEKTIEILQPNGAATNAFVYRDKINTPFLELGEHTDLTFGQIRFDFTTIERRSEPTWI